MKKTLISLALLAGLVGAPLPLLANDIAPVAKVVPANAPDPARQIEDLARLFRASDVAGLAQAIIPHSRWQIIRARYEQKRFEPSSDEDRAEFAEKIGRVIAPDAVDTFMVEFEPELEKARPQVPGALLMGFGAMQMAVSSPESDLTDEQREVLRGAIPGIQQWASSTDFLDSATMRDALTLLTDAARNAGVRNLDEFKALPLEEVLRRAGGVLDAAKDAAQLYGIDLDAVADSLQVEVLGIVGDTARVRTSITLFDAPLWTEHELVLVEGRWYGKDIAVDFSDEDDEDEFDG